MEQAKVDLRGKIPDTGHRLRSLLCTSFVEQRSISFERRAQPACPPQLQELGDRRIVPPSRKPAPARLRQSLRIAAILRGEPVCLGFDSRGLGDQSRVRL